MANDWVTDHKWRDIRYADLPDWAKRRVKELDRYHLFGRSFEYQRERTTGRYQRRLRRHTPQAALWIKQKLAGARQNCGKFFILLTIFATITVLLSGVGLSISGTISLTAGIVISLVSLGIVLWSLRTLSRRKPRVARIVMVLLVSLIFVMFSSAYLDIRSLRDVKESIMGAFSTEEGQFRSSVDLFVQRVELTIVDIASIPEEQEHVGETTEEPETSEELDATEYVLIDGGILVGADGHPITLQNNPEATNPTWQELKSFLLKDTTDSKRYDIETFVCADFAEMLHNNAESAGIRVAYVSIWLGPCSYYLFGGGHALNAFETTDRGLVYIDCTSSNQGVNADKIVGVEVGKEYVPRSIFPEPGWEDTWLSMGIVEEIEAIKW